MLSQKKIVEHLKDSSVYPHETDEEIQVVETHISWVFLTGIFAYKLKKELKFGDILDFSTLEKRKRACGNEITLNKRLASEIYLERVMLNTDLKLTSDGNALEYLVKMKQLPQKNLLLHKVQNAEKIEKEIIEKIAVIVADFHKNNVFIPEESVYDSIYEKWDESFRTTRSYKGYPYDSELERRVFSFLESNKTFFESRPKYNKIVDGHGDLILANIFQSNNDVVIFDCIEFNDLLRIQDVYEEIAFLAMDLDFHKLFELSDLFITRYLEETSDNLSSDFPIIDFYKSYRAYVRAKVYFSQTLQENDSTKMKELKSLTERYMILSSSYEF